MYMVSTSLPLPLRYIYPTMIRPCGKGIKNLKPCSSPQTTTKNFPSIQDRLQITRMATSRNWFKLIRRKFVRSSARDIIVVHTEDSSSNLHEETIILEHPNSPPASTDSTTPQKQVLTKQDIAAIKIQAFFRGHLVLSPTLYFIIA